MTQLSWHCKKCVKGSITVEKMWYKRKEDLTTLQYYYFSILNVSYIFFVRKFSFFISYFIFFFKFQIEELWRIMHRNLSLFLRISWKVENLFANKSFYLLYFTRKARPAELGHHEELTERDISAKNESFLCLKHNLIFFYCLTIYCKIMDF